MNFMDGGWPDGPRARHRLKIFECVGNRPQMLVTDVKELTPSLQCVYIGTQ